MTVYDTQYQALIKAIMEDGYEEVNERTGHTTRILPGMTLEIPPDAGFPVLTLRKIPTKIFIAEQIWFISGSRKPSEFLNDYTRIWDDFTNVDGVVTAAYGWRWRHHFGRDQLGLLIDLLQKEPSSRQAVIIMWDAAGDGLSTTLRKKNVPCPYTFTVNIIGGLLHLHLVIRSNDMILGNPHDVAGFALLQRILAQKLHVGVGKLTVSISNAHIYDVHYEAAKEIIKRNIDHKPFELTMPENAFERAEKQEPTLVDEFFQQFKIGYKPLEPIKGLEIVL